MQYLVVIGRFLFALIFVLSTPGHFTKATIGFAAAHGVPMASIMVPLSGLLALAGGLSIMLGYKTRWGALALIVFLVPVTLAMHNFWAVADPGAAMMQRIMFEKNVSMLGGTLLIAYFGAGPLSLDERKASRSASPGAAKKEQ